MTARPTTEIVHLLRPQGTGASMARYCGERRPPKGCLRTETRILPDVTCRKCLAEHRRLHPHGPPPSMLY